MHTIAIDCGASFVKCALFENGALIRSKQVNAPPVVDGNSIFDTAKIETLVEIVKGIVREFSSNLEQMMVCIDNEMHGFILAKEDGTPYTDYISWQTELISAEEVRSFLDQSIGQESREAHIRKSGMPLRAGLPSATLLWMKKKGWLDDQPRMFFYTLGDYLNSVIFGIVPSCHPTNAAATGLYDLENSDWNWDYITAITGKSNIVFPVIGKETKDCRVGSVRYHVLPAIGDQQAALLGSGLYKTDALSFNMGTGAQVSRLIETLSYGNYQTRPYFYGKYLKTIPHIPSGRIISVYFRFVRDICRRIDNTVSDEKIWEMMREAADTSGDCGGEMTCDLSFFENAVTDHTVGSITNITEYGFTFDNLMRSIFSQMTRNFIEISDRVNEDLPKYESVIFSGGIARRWNNLRNRIVDGLQVSEESVVISTGDTLFGCMLYAQMSIGER